MMQKEAVFLGGVAPASQSERDLAYECGRIIGHLGYTLLHGGYNGLMEDAARGAAMEGANILALTLEGKEEWGNFNPYVKNAFYSKDFGQRLNNFFSSAKVIIAMGGGVGTLHEITSAVWYAGNIRPVPMILLGTRANNLIAVLKEQQWVYESPTRPLDFLYSADTAQELDAILHRLENSQTLVHNRNLISLEDEVFKTALVNSDYVRADGVMLTSYFDPFRLSTNPKLLHALAVTAVKRIKTPVDAVAGIALGGVALATYIAQILDKPLLMIRPVTKAYGTFAQVEGLVGSGNNVLVVDDVVRQGTSVMLAQNALEKVGLLVTEATCVLSYGDTGRERLEKSGIILNALYDR